MPSKKEIYSIVGLVIKNIEKYTSFLLLIALVIVLSLQIFYRYFLGLSIPWAEEVSRFVFVVMVYLSISFAAQRGRHIRIMMQFKWFKERTKILILSFADIIWISYNTFIIVKGIEMVNEMFSFRYNSPVLNIPMYFVYGIIPLSFGIMNVRVIQNMINRFRTKEIDIRYVE